MTERANTLYKNGSRFYSFPDGVQHPGVTSILASLPAPWLGAWNGKMAAEFAVDHMTVLTDLMDRGDRKAAVELVKGAARRSTSGSADLGTRVHEFCERTLLGDAVEDAQSEDEALMRTAFEAFVRDWKPELIISEATVRNETVGFAGSFDSVLNLGGINVLVDYKSGKAVRESAVLQLNAYANAESLADGSPMPKIEAAAILHIRPTGCLLYPAKLSDEAYDYFKACRKIFDWETTKRSFLGKPITPNN